MKNSFALLFLLLFLVILQTSIHMCMGACPDYAPVFLRVEPANIVLGAREDNCVGDIFTVTVNVYDVQFLYGLDIRLLWNTTYVEYVRHTVKIPVETYSDGVLYEPVLELMDKANVSQGWCWIGYSSLYDAETFNGTGTILEIAFEVKHQPVEPEITVEFPIEIVDSALADIWACGGIPHYVENCHVKIRAWASPDINRDGVVNIFDVVIAAHAYGNQVGDSDWNQLADLCPEWGIIDIFDLVTLAYRYGETIP